MAASVTSDPAVKMRVGLVDDDLSVRRALSRLLRTHGYDCMSFDSAEAALSDPDFRQMNCVILDVQLGGMGGFELGKRLQSLGFYMPQIFISAHIKSDFPHHSQPTAVLIKPFDESQLIDLIQGATGSASSDLERLS
jgi:FixJ family two-component response regulator